MRKTKTAVLISGNGSNLQALLDAAAAPDYPAEIVLVLSNKPEAYGLTRAEEVGVKTCVVDHKSFDNREKFEESLHVKLLEAGVELICLAGFMRLFTAGFVETWRDKILNIHPSLLPSFKGLNVHQRMVDTGVKIAGCTVHVVRPEMDDGPIIGQAAVPVLSDDTADTLAARILKAEHKLYPACLKLIASGAARIDGDRVVTPEGDAAAMLVTAS
ncbi:MAG: phosphoribosylglycinamide formyltransferase [Pseudomonadota bacterium]